MFLAPAVRPISFIIESSSIGSRSSSTSGGTATLAPGLAVGVAGLTRLCGWLVGVFGFEMAAPIGVEGCFVPRSLPASEGD